MQFFSIRVFFLQLSLCCQVVRCEGDNTGLLRTILNGLNLGMKNVIDQFMPSIGLPSVPGQYDISLPSVNIPIPIGRNDQIFPIGCPKCKNLLIDELVGTWHIIYSSDNFLRLYQHLFLQIAKDTAVENSFSNDVPVKPSFGDSQTLQNLLNPMKMPVCMKLQVGKPLSYGFLTDYPVLLTFRQGLPRSQQFQLLGRFRQVAEGKYTLSFGGDKLILRVCALESNFNNPVATPDFQIPPDVKVPEIPAGLNSFNLTGIGGLPDNLNGLRPDEILSAFNGRPKPSASVPPNLFPPADLPSPTRPPITPLVQSYTVTRGTTATTPTVPLNSGNFQLTSNDTNATVSRLAKRQIPDSILQQLAGGKVPLPPAFLGNKNVTAELLGKSLAKFFVLGDMSGFPSCQNFLVMTTDPLQYFALFDAELTSMATKMGANSDTNPLHYIPCPCGL